MFNQKASRQVLETVAEKLTANGFTAAIVSSGIEAKAKVLEMISKAKEDGSEVMTMTSITLNTLGIPQALKDGGYILVRDKFADPATTPKHKRELGAAPDISMASVHAITHDGVMLIASQTGSQLPAAAYGAGKVIFVVGNQKIVENLEQGMKRIYEYVLPLESERANKAYNSTKGSSVNKVLILNKEIQKDRVFVILVEEPLGF